MDASFFFNDTATTEIYTLSLHDALPISLANSYLAIGNNFDILTVINKVDLSLVEPERVCEQIENVIGLDAHDAILVSAKTDRKSTRLNSSHLVISYAVFCLKKKNRRSLC